MARPTRLLELHLHVGDQGWHARVRASVVERDPWPVAEGREGRTRVLSDEAGSVPWPELALFLAGGPPPRPVPPSFPGPWRGAGFGRIVVEAPGELWARLVPKRPADHLRPLDERPVLLFRHPAPPVRSEPVGLPLRVASRLVGEPPLSDPFLEEAARHGHLQWVGADDPAPIVRALAQDLAGLDPVRLAVVEGEVRAEDLVAALDRGTGAVLVAPRGADRALAAFLRKVLHDWPLDRCADAALREQDVPLLLAAREEGELGTLLSRGLSEWVGELEGALGPGLRGPTTTKAPRGAHADRVLLDLGDRLRSSAKRAVREVRERLVGLDDRDVHEIHDLGELLTADRDLAAVVPLVVASREVEDADAPAPRLTNVWLAGEGEAPLTRAPEVGEAVALHVRIEPHARRGAVGSAFPEELLARAFERLGSVDLDVRVFHADDVAVETSHATLSLPRVGASQPFVVRVTFLELGPTQLRVCLYHERRVLQSVRVPVDVGSGAAPRAELDYVASPDLLLVGDREAPRLSLFTNDARDGSHWLGVVGAAGDQEFSDLRTFSDAALRQLADLLRGALGDAQVGQATREAPTDAERKLREAALVRLAIAGWRAFQSLFRTDGPSPEARQRRQRLKAALAVPGVVTVARCKADATSVPWSALHDRPLDTGRPAEIRLCPSFAERLRDGAETCAATCPGGDPELVVCPFGFWGVRHVVEQPLQQVTPTPAGAVPPELARDAFAEQSRIPVEGGARLLVGFDPSLPAAVAHVGVVTGGHALSRQVGRRSEIRQALRGAEDRVVYLYCHGEIDEAGIFRLKLKEDGAAAALDAASLDPTDEPARPFLVFLNACESAAMTPERAHSLLAALNTLGAQAVLGTEAEVRDVFARPLGEGLLGRLLTPGQGLGEALRAERRELLAASLNPVGLLYTLHGPADAHLHDVACVMCPPEPG